MTPCEIPNFEALVSTLAENDLNEHGNEYGSSRCCLAKESLCDMSLTRAHDDACMSALPTSLAQATDLAESENAATWTGTLSETGASSCAVDTLMLCDSFTTQLSACTSAAHAQSSETLGDKTQIPLHDYFARGMTSPLASLLHNDEATKDKDNRRRKKYSKSPGFYSVSPMTKNRYMNPPTATLSSSPTNTTMPKSARLTMDMNMEPNCDYCDFPSPTLLSNTSPSKNANNGAHAAGDDDEVGDGKDDDDDDISPHAVDKNYVGLADEDSDTNTGKNYNDGANLAVNVEDDLENDAGDGDGGEDDGCCDDDDDNDNDEGENCLAATTAITGERNYYNQLKKNDLLNVAVDINSTTSSCATTINTRLQNAYIPINDRSKENQMFIKILATQLVSGTIIGRGGKGLNWFRRKSRVGEIKLSMPWELYPKTEYRTLLFRGSIKAVLKATCIIADLMLSKYSANHAKVFNHTDKMIVMVVLPCAFQAAMEDIKKTTDPAILSITLFKDDGNHREIVAVLKGNKTKIKELVVAIVTSISETVDPADYCFVAYPNAATLPLKRAAVAGGTGIGVGSLAMRTNTSAPDQMELSHHYQQQQQNLHHQLQEENWRLKDYGHVPCYPSAPVQGICNNINMEALDDKVKNQHVVIQTHLPPHLITRAIKLANIYKCNFQATNAVDTVSNGNGNSRGNNTGMMHSHGGSATGNDDNCDNVKCEISGPFGDCCTAASIIFSLV